MLVATSVAHGGGTCEQNEGRKLWSNIIYGTRSFARAVWFHVPDYFLEEGKTEDETRARLLIEKKTVINLLQGFAVSTSHILSTAY